MSDEKSAAAKKEEEILEFWRNNQIFEKTLQKEASKGEFVFYEGPPTANGRPGIHHLESRAFKDAIPRFKTMQGYHVARKAGWDTHGLPVELEVEKELGISTKGEIEEYGIGAFNNKCKESVWKYIDEWQEFTRRMGYWLDLDNPYVTYHPQFMESVWNRLGAAAERDLLYEDYKVVPWCPRCETTLSSHELAQGYKTVTDLTVTAKFKLIDAPKEISGGENTYVLAWTTTPWTLPANVALAVGEDISYSVVATDYGRVVVADDRIKDVVGDDVDVNIVKEITGKQLVDLSYEPLYDFVSGVVDADNKERFNQNAHKIYAADFVTTEDGTGVVHTAVMYGQDDFALGQDQDLPRVHLVDQTGHFVDGTDFLAGRFVHDEAVAVDIIKDLYHRDGAGETGLLFDKSKYDHEYPHCWRCKTPLVYYARNSWYIRMTDLREELIAENQKINWEPSHIKNGRFGEWLDGVKDWAVSRERFWGTPLPIWQSEDGEKTAVITSVADLKNKVKSSNNLIAMRHGEAEHNVEGRADSGDFNTSSLTEKGEKEASVAAEELAKRPVDIVYVSPYARARETAAIITKKLDLPDESVIVDDRIGEFNFGEFAGRPISDYRGFRQSGEDDVYYTTPATGGESHLDAKRRIGDFLYDIDAKHEGKNILIISHGLFLEVAPAVVEGADLARSKEIMRDYQDKPTGTMLELDFAPLPHNEDFELDLHRPYVDEIAWEEDGKVMRRVPDVMDVWFDSGAVPFAQHHYPFENNDYVDNSGYPADFISEAIDQTRGWFYTLHAIGVLSGKGRAVKNIICLGHILDEEGAKMSKSVGNTVDPWEAMDEFGADAIRFWMYSINQPGESKNFSAETVDEITKKVFNLVRNVARFYEMYRDDELTLDKDPHESPDVLDQWILNKLDQLTGDATTSLEAYDLLTPTRAIREFIGDLSQWYIRRSRDRFKSDDDTERLWALVTTKHVLDTLARLLAPFTPFLAEELYQDVIGESESVHLTSWPKAKGGVDEDLLADMEEVRSAVSHAHDLRSQAGIKVRQPLAALTLRNESLAGQKELLEIIADEVNVEKVVFDAELEEPCRLDTELTADLEEKGAVRELVRNIQRLRKQADLDPFTEITLTITTDEPGKDLVERFKEEITTTATVAGIEFTEVSAGAKVETNGFTFTVEIS